jgi:hypothetical protein
VAAPGNAEDVYEEPVLDAWVIIVRLWWEQAGAGDVAMRARATTSAGDAVAGATGAASTVDGVVAVVRAAVDRFVASRPRGVGDADG